MKLVSWNVNGIRAVAKKDFFTIFEEMSADILCLQETKAQDDQVAEALKDLNICLSFPGGGKERFVQARHRLGRCGAFGAGDQWRAKVNGALGREEDRTEMTGLDLIQINDSSISFCFIFCSRVGNYVYSIDLFCWNILQVISQVVSC